MTKLQSVAIRSAFLKAYSMFALEHMTTRTGAETLKPNPQRAQVYYDHYQDNLKAFSKLVVDGKQAVSLADSLSFPTTPCIISHKLNPDGCKQNGVWLSKDHKAQLLKSLGEMQAEGLSQRARRVAV